MKNIEKPMDFEKPQTNLENLFKTLQEEGINDWQAYLKIAVLSRISKEVEKNGIAIKEKYFSIMPGYEKLIDFLDKKSGNLKAKIAEIVEIILENDRFQELISKGDFKEIREKFVEPLINDENIVKSLEDLRNDYKKWLEEKRQRIS